MVAFRVIPCLDIKDGRVVKGVRFQDLRDAGDPAASAAAYEEQGGDEIVLATKTVRRVRADLSIPLTVGGGIRSADDAARLLEAGADKVAVNTAAVTQPGLLTDMADRFGAQCTVLSVDAASRNDRGWEVVVSSGRTRTGIDVMSWCQQATDAGAGEILLTSWDRDGTRNGYDTNLVAAVASTVRVPVIASGGAANAAHLVAAINAGASAVLVASILHNGETTVAHLKSRLDQAGIEVRP